MLPGGGPGARGNRVGSLREEAADEISGQLVDERVPDIQPVRRRLAVLAGVARRQRLDPHTTLKVGLLGNQRALMASLASY